MSYGDEDRREANRWMGWGWAQVIIGIFIILVITGILWLGGVFTSGAKGEGEAYKQQQSADNRIKMQAEFNKRYQSILSQDKKIQIAADALAKDPDDQVKEINLTGLKNNCVSSVGEYNALVDSYLAKEWKDEDLPDKIDETDPKTDCKEN